MGEREIARGIVETVLSGRAGPVLAGEDNTVDPEDQTPSTPTVA